MSNVTASAAEREPTPAQDVKPGDWIAGDPGLAGPAKVLFVHPFLQDGRRRIAITYEETPDGRPASDIWEHGHPVRLATAEEIEASKVPSRRVQLVERLRSLADLIEQKQLPLADHWSHLDFHFKDVESIAEVAAKLATTVAIDSAGRHSVIWNQERTDSPLRVEWFTYVRDDEPKPEPVADPSGLGFSREPKQPDCSLCEQDVPGGTKELVQHQVDVHGLDA